MTADVRETIAGDRCNNYLKSAHATICRRTVARQLPKSLRVYCASWKCRNSFRVVLTNAAVTLSSVPKWAGIDDQLHTPLTLPSVLLRTVFSLYTYTRISVLFYFCITTCFGRISTTIIRCMFTLQKMFHCRLKLHISCECDVDY